MKIYINGRFLTQSITGVQRYAHEVIKALDDLIECGEISAKYEVLILAPKNISQKIKLKNINIKIVGSLKGHLWEQIELPFFSRKGLLINLCNVAPALKRNQIVVIHDAAVYLDQNNFSIVFRIWYKLLFNLEVRFSKKIITVSKFSLNEIIKYTPINSKKIEVIYEGNEHIKNIKAEKQILNKQSLLKKPFVLSVGSLDPRKNFKNLLCAAEKLDNENFDIVIAGGANPRIFKGEKFVFPSNLRYLGYVSDEQLKALYEHAFCFVYPSLYEGFGLPPLEAMTLGCPVIVSNRTSIPEICGESVMYCDPENPFDIAEKITNLFNNKLLRDYYRELGIKRSNLFSWKSCAIKMWKTVISK